MLGLSRNSNWEAAGVLCSPGRYRGGDGVADVGGELQMCHVLRGPERILASWFCK